MPTDESNINEKLVEALAWFDEDSRLDRVKRIDRASSLYQSPGIVSGEFVPLAMMEEARDCFVNGQYMAAVLCAASLIEHLIVAKLENKSGASSNKLTLGMLLDNDSVKKIFPAETLDRLKELNELRNPLAHRRATNDKTTLTNRYLTRQVHPHVVMENDARLSLEIMYEFILQVLKHGDR